MARRFTKYPSSYVRASLLDTKGWNRSETAPEGTTSYYKEVPEIDTIFYIKEKPNGKGYTIRYWPRSEKYSGELGNAENLAEATKFAEDKIEQYIRIYGRK